MADSRYSRQELIEGWDQSKWSNLTAIVLGDGLLGQQIYENIIAMGIGKAIIIGNKKRKRISNLQESYSDGYLSEDIIADRAAQQSIVSSAKQFLSRVNPDVRQQGLHWYLQSKSLFTFIKNADIIFDATADDTVKEQVSEHCKTNKLFLISGKVGKYYGAFYLGTENQKNLEQLIGLKRETEEIIPSMIIGAMMVEEARKHFMPYDEAETKNIETLFKYDLFSKERFSLSNIASISLPPHSKSETTLSETTLPKTALQNKNILCIGAGALGTPVTAGLVLLGANKITLLDYDTPNESNLARQIFYYDSLGKPKSETLARKLSQLNPELTITALNAKLVAERDDQHDAYVKGYRLITPQELQDNNYDIIFSCLDNFKARVLLEQIGIPLVHGGTSYSSTKVVFYLPGITQSPSQQFRFHDLAEEELDRDSCDNVAEPSIMTTSKICAGLMLGEGLRYLAAQTTTEKAALHNDCINGFLTYNTFEPKRAVVIRRENNGASQ